MGRDEVLGIGVNANEQVDEFELPLNVQRVFRLIDEYHGRTAIEQENTEQDEQHLHFS